MTNCGSDRPRARAAVRPTDATTGYRGASHYGSSGSSLILEEALHALLILLQEALINLQVVARVATKDDFLDRRQRRQHFSNGRDCHFGGVLDRITVCTCTDTGERNRGRVDARCHFERATIARCEQLRLSMRAAAPDWSHGMNHVFRWQAIAVGELRIPRRTAVQLAALLEQLRACCSVYRSIHPAAAQKGGIGCIDDCIDLECRDVRLNRFDLRHETSPRR